MIYATLNNELVTPAPGLHATCPCCKGDVIAKCGQINVWHWAHKIKDCDLWSEPETPWHLGWKSLFPRNQTEVVMSNHRADAVNQNGVVFEFQHSPMDVETMQEREAFYGEKMIWVLDGSLFRLNFKLWDDKVFEWKRLRKTWLQSQRPIFIDFGEDKTVWPTIDRRNQILDKYDMAFIKNLIPIPPKTKRVSSFISVCRVGNVTPAFMFKYMGMGRPAEYQPIEETFHEYIEKEIRRTGIYHLRTGEAAGYIKRNVVLHGTAIPFSKQRFISKYIP